jgi:hypothetical protein
MGTKVPRFHQSTANTLLKSDPLQAWLEHPDLGGDERDPSAAMDRGTIVHGLLLGGSNFEELDFADFRTNAAKAARDAVRAQGRTPVLSHKLAELRETVGACRAALLEAGINLSRYKREHNVLWTSPEGIECEGTLDAFDDASIVDVKVCESAHPEKFSRHVYDFGYDVQAAAYTEALDTLEPERAGRRQYIWAVVEPDAPYRCLVRNIGAMYLEIGRNRWSRAKATWQRCLRENSWPDYTEGTLAIEPPGYIIKREEELSYEQEV